MHGFQITVPIYKVDEEQRLVYGLVSEEIVDQQGEILDYESSAPLFAAWSERISKATGGASAGNLRLMHQPIVAGKLTDLVLDDAAKQISCTAKVVDDESWNLVKEGCLSGFSMGGKYVRRWTDAANKKVKRFTASPVEVSLVDNPAVPTATFEYVKADGSTEVRKFHHGDEIMDPTQEEIAQKAAELAAAAGTPDAADGFMEEARTTLIEAAKAAAGGGGEGDESQAGEGDAGKAEGAAAAGAAKGAEGEGGAGGGSAATGTGGETGDGTAAEPVDGAVRKARRKEIGDTLKQVWQAPDGSVFATKDAAIDAIETGDAAPESRVDKALRDAMAKAQGGDAAGGDESPVDAAALTALLEQITVVHKGLEAAQEHIAPLTKGLWDVRSLASIVQEMSYLVSSARDEAAREGDGSTVPQQLFAATAQLGNALIAMAQEETAELLNLLGAGSDWADAIVPVPADVIVVELSALVDMTKANESVMQKAGARNSRSDAKRIQDIHDASKALGADCGAEKGATAEGDGGEIDIDEHPVVKGLRADNTRLEGEVEKAVGGIADLGGRLEALTAELAAFKKTAQPLPPRTDAIVIDRGSGRPDTITQEMLEKMTDDERLDLVIRASQLRPQHVGG